MFELGFFDSLFWCVGFACIPLLILLILKGKNLFLTLSSILSIVVIAINLSLAVDSKWMAFLNDFVNDWTTVHDYLFYFALLIDVVAAVLLLLSKTTRLHTKIFGIFAIANLALVLSSNVFNFYTCGVNYHLFNSLPTQTTQPLALICTFVLYFRLLATAGLALTLILVKTQEEKQRQLEEVKEEILDIVDACKEALRQQKQQEEFEQLAQELKNDKELNDLLGEIEQELAKAEQEVEQPTTEQPQAEQPQAEQPQVEEQPEPQVEQPQVEQPQVEQSTTEQPQAEQPQVEEQPEPQVEQPQVEEVNQEQSLKDLTLIKEFEVQPATQLITATDTTEERTTQTIEIIEEKTDPNDQAKKETVVVATTATTPKKSTTKKSTTTKSSTTKSTGAKSSSTKSTTAKSSTTKSTTAKSSTTKKTDSKPPIKKFVSYIVKSEAVAEAPNMYCQYCGTKVHSDSQICPRCFNQMEHLYLCKNCHTLNAQTTCENCGQKLD